MKEIRILVKNVGEKLEERTIDGELNTMQKIVGGILDVVGLPEGIDMWVDDEGLLKGSKVNLILIDSVSNNPLQYIVGNVFFASSDDEDETIGLSDEQVKWLKGNVIDIGYNEKSQNVVSGIYI